MCDPVIVIAKRDRGDCIESRLDCSRMIEAVSPKETYCHEERANAFALIPFCMGLSMNRFEPGCRLHRDKYRRRGYSMRMYHEVNAIKSNTGTEGRMES